MFKEKFKIHTFRLAKKYPSNPNAPLAFPSKISHASIIRKIIKLGGFENPSFLKNLRIPPV